MQTSAAATFQPTESLFAVYREPFFNTIGQKRTLPPHFRMSALPPKADISENRRQVR